MPDEPTIWIDADGAPRPVKDIVFRASARLGVPVVLVANKAQHLPKSRHVRQVQVGQGLDVADDHIVEHCAPGDLVVSADVPLAALVVCKGAEVLQPHGVLLDAGNVGQKLSERDVMTELRASGLAGGGPPAFGPRDRERFANALDRWLAKRRRRR